MNGNERRVEILKELEHAKKPVSGTLLAKKMGVSRQVIVQDMALLRASDKNIISTTRGYLLYKEDVSKVKRAFVVRHTNENIREELYSIVDCGGKMLDVSVFHNVYGMITVDLIIQNRREADDFLQKMNKINSEPLLTLTAFLAFFAVNAAPDLLLYKKQEKLPSALSVILPGAFMLPLLFSLPQANEQAFAAAFISLIPSVLIFRIGQNNLEAGIGAMTVKR